MTHRPWREMDDVSFVPGGARPPEGAAMWIEFDGRRSAMRMQGSYAAPRNSAALSAALRAAAANGVAEAVIGWSADPGGNETAETPARSFRFALAGLAEAHTAIGEACEAVP